MYVHVLVVIFLTTLCLQLNIINARSPPLQEICQTMVKNETKTLASELINDYGENGRLNLKQFKKLYDQLVAHGGGGKHHVVVNGYNNSNGYRIDDGDLVNVSSIKCPSIEEIYNVYNDGMGLTSITLPQALSSLVYLILNQDCQSSSTKNHLKPTSGQVWGYGLGFVTLICVISNVGGVLSPIMEKEFFQKLLTFLVAMAVGTLAATGLMVLLPEAFDLMSVEELADDYLWKAATAMAGIYIFYMSERMLKVIFYRPKEPDSLELAVKQPLATQNDHSHSHLPAHINQEIESGERTVSTVAWMVLIGDALHNFVDGLSIGAAFTENIYTGVSVSIAVVCEELPHELGDIAILLHSGLSMKRALLYNFLAAVICYAGLIIGILLGENTSANRWIFAIAGGLFLYVSLVDMLPELSHTADEFQKQKANPWKIMFIQNMGLFLGFGIILTVAYYAGQIVIEG